ncbi:alpha/beta hydrolase [Mycobacterium malmoense]|uniref:Esterase n=1 Tax=Mycobacterium malmoense TaxID=1780 RepID=A0ABX3SW07_MYCMA|nr:alpha/beta hydrolase [Mycobacterium malmoense]ORA84802.1 esterase [Mycobacterium malmoense]QZA19719.1 alpha/beta hydrolase [Mycobacterium malmoense]UNB96471.1 alpha/beta hydrolase [Mycobacterium malmoense]
MASTGDSPTLLPSGAVQRRIHHRHSPQSVAVSLASRLIVKNAVRVWAIQPNLHWPFEYVDGFAGLVPRFGASAHIEPVRLEHCAAEWVRAPGVSGKRAVLYLHGGAFLTCGLNTHRALVTRLSKAADAAVLNVGYRKLPAHQITDAIDDGISGLRWLQDRGFDGDRVVVAGDSAGGYLAFVTALLAIRSQVMRPAGIATVSPFTDADPARKLRHRAGRCFMFTRGALSMFAQYLSEAQLLNDRGDSAGRIVSPVDADLSSLPPVTIHASRDELLLPDAELMAERLDASGIRCDLHLWDGQIHDFPLAAEILPEGRRAIRYIGDFVKDVTAASGTLPARRDESWRRSVRATAAAG